MEGYSNIAKAKCSVPREKMKKLWKPHFSVLFNHKGQGYCQSLLTHLPKLAQDMVKMTGYKEYQISQFTLELQMWLEI